MNSFSDLIAAIGTAKVAKLLGVQTGHVRAMKARNSVAPEHWGALIQFAQRRGMRGVTWRRLKALRDARFGAGGAKP